MDEPFARYLDWLSAHDVPASISSELARHDDHDGPLVPPGDSPRRVTLGRLALEEHFDGAGGFAADHATWSVARVLDSMGADVFSGATCADVGCGTGVLATVMAKFGARVVATDVDEGVMRLARATAEANGVDLDLRRGSLLEPFGDEERFDVFVANLPHKPAQRTEGLHLSQAGGTDGTGLFSVALSEMARRQEAGARLCFFLHSLPHPRLLGEASRDYDLEIAAWKIRWFQPGEYGALHDHFRTRASEGTSFLHTEGDREGMVACVWWARRKGGPS